MLRKTISFLAKGLYNSHYLLLRKNLNYIYSTVDFEDPVNKYDILTKFLISGEDHRFKYHPGFDLIAILRAIKNRIFYRKFEGASTIEQQLVRVLTNDFEKTLKRKIREIFLSTIVRDIVPRKKVPLLYLHVAYYGYSMNGLNQILKKLNVNKRNKITKELAAEIVSRIKYPEPLVITDKRTLQISQRKQHLLLLYQKHSNRKILTIYD